MLVYRLMTMDPARSVLSVEDVHCRNNREAVELAKTRALENGVEIWQQWRFVAWIPPSKSVRRAA